MTTPKNILNRLQAVQSHLSASPIPPAATIMTKKPDITLYTAQTPNGIKISMALEELGLPYKTVPIDITKNTQKEDWFLEINPNGRIPAMTDSWSDSEGKDTIRLFESGSILLYLTEQYDPEHKLSFPRGTREAYEMNNWLFFQNAGLGPMQGQSNHFYRYAPEKIEYPIKRYLNESRRLYGVLDKHLATSSSGFIIGDHISIADITTVGWVWTSAWSGVKIDEFPNLKKWEEMLWERPALKKGRDVPTEHRGKFIDLENADKKAAEAREWILKGMKEDEKNHQA